MWHFTNMKKEGKKQGCREGWRGGETRERVLFLAQDAHCRDTNVLSVWFKQRLLDVALFLTPV